MARSSRSATCATHSDGAGRGSRSCNERGRSERLIGADGGAAFLDRLLSSRRAADLGLKRGRGKWFVTFERTRALSDLDPALDYDGEVAEPGPFRAEVDSFDLGQGTD